MRNKSLPTEVFEKELETIEERRKTNDTASTIPCDGGAPAVERGLVGLALSGGGIRSATLGLGVLQVLAKRDLFKYFDYTSTVSGGGYTGSMLGSLLGCSPVNNQNQPLQMRDGEEESEAMQRLRSGSNYLSPGGLWESLRLAAIIVRGLILNFLILLPYIMLLVIATEYLHERPVDLSSLRRPDSYSFFLYSAVALAGYLLITGVRFFPASWSQRNRYELSVTVAMTLVLLAVFVIPLYKITHWAIQIPYHHQVDAMTNNLSLLSWGLALLACTAGITLVKASGNLSAIAGKVCLFAVAIAGPAGLFAVYLLLVIAQVDSPFLEIDNERVIFAVEDPSLSNYQLEPQHIKAFELKGIYYSVESIGNFDLSTVDVAARYCALNKLLLLAKPEAELAKLDLDGEIKFPDCENITLDDSKWGDKQIYAVQHDDGQRRTALYGANLHIGGDAGSQTMVSDAVFLGLALSLIFLNLVFLDVNRSSLHYFYRDRLSKLYLFRRSEKGDIVANDEVLLSALNEPGTIAPYHIINTTLNLQGSRVESQRGRDGELFFFSKHFCGSVHTGYCATSEMEARDSHINLGTAMAISAGALAPNMGSTTIRSLVFVLTLLNLRLGYWVPNPSFVRAGRKFLVKPHTFYLLREALGKMVGTTRYVNLSDGGHLENLGAFELLRRKCSTIVLVDGEADPGHTFSGLVTLIRLVRIDLGIRIDIDLKDLQLDENRECRSHYVVGKIDYGVEGEGTLVYIKSSLTAQQTPFLCKYRLDSPAFPHETTADQFFDERQFEAYRSLGERIGEDLVDDAALDLAGLLGRPR